MANNQVVKRSLVPVDAELSGTDELALAARTGSPVHNSGIASSASPPPPTKVEHRTGAAAHGNEIDKIDISADVADAARSSPASDIERSPTDEIRISADVADAERLALASIMERSPTPIWTLEEYLKREKERYSESPEKRQQNVKEKDSSVWDRIMAPNKRPGLIIVGQALILSTAWSFFIFVHYKQVVPLPQGLALAATMNPTVLTLIVTLLATVVSAVSSLLLSFSIRHAINYYLLRRSLPVIILGNCIKVLNGAFIFDIKDLRWMFIALFAIVMTGTQTAGWTTLVTPIGITIDTPLHGVELDITNDQYIQGFRQMTGQAGASVLLTNIREYIELGGVASAIAVSPNANSQINYLDLTFNVSTNGILPTTIHPPESSDDRQVSSGNPGVIATSDRKPLPEGLSGNFTVKDHQGLTANVTCYPWRAGKGDPIYQTNYIVSSTDIAQPSTGNSSLDSSSSPATLYTYRYSWDCQNNTKWTDYLYTFDNSTLAGISCPDERKEGVPGPTNYTLVLVGGSGVELVRSTTVVCHIVPQVTVVEADYGAMVYTTKTTVLPNATAEAMSDLGIYVVQRLFSLAQRHIGNSIAESLSNIDVAQGTSSNDGQLAYHLFGAFIKGVFEYTTTVIGVATRFDEGPTFRNLTGVYHTQTVGYIDQPGVAIVALLPITCVGIGSLLILLFVFVHQRHDRHNMRATSNSKDGSPTAYDSFIDFNNSRNLESSDAWGTRDDIAVEEELRVFDISDPLHLLAVASSGGISDVFRSGLRDAQMKASHKVNLKLGSLFDAENGKRRVGLQHDDRQWLVPNSS